MRKCGEGQEIKINQRSKEETKKKDSIGNYKKASGPISSAPDADGRKKNK